MIKYNKISKNKNRVTEVNVFRDITTFSARKEVYHENCTRSYFVHGSDMERGRLTFSLKHNPISEPIIYINGLRVSPYNDYDNCMGVVFNMEDGTYYFNSSDNIKEGDNILAEYVTKDKILSSL